MIIQLVKKLNLNLKDFFALDANLKSFECLLGSYWKLFVMYFDRTGSNKVDIFFIFTLLLFAVKYYYLLSFVLLSFYDGFIVLLS